MIRFVLSDLDGTLITSKRELTNATKYAVHALDEAGIGFTIISGRPPLGMSFIVKDLSIKVPFVAFEGAMLVWPDLRICDQLTLDPKVAEQLIKKLVELKLDPWIYQDKDWLVTSPNAPHIAREAETVRFSPKVVASFSGDLLKRVVKIVGVSDDLDQVARAERELREAYQNQATVARSQNYYLDITHPQANKGSALERLAGILHIPPKAIATLGDMPNDIAMFPLSGLSFAVGNASDSVKSNATHTVASNDNDGFAEAAQMILKQSRGALGTHGRDLAS